ncbi:hypothetical protein BaOVIS_018300 [Babesia ovis]|uniref:Uncharacterized protein n=1 Tax=Babesia ovis TaxID=5869 RepID=A0A9W5TBQ0_BABOV|nr:hypothetical protein BaOVIS_018300 [Babesia ovis]
MGRHGAIMRQITPLALLYIANRCSQSVFVESIRLSVREGFLWSAAPPPQTKVLLPLSADYVDYLEDPREYSSNVDYSESRYPPYPYYDAPRNLFFSIEAKDDSTDDDFDLSETQRTYMENSTLRRNGEDYNPLDSSPIAVFDRSIGKDHRDYVYSAGAQHPRDEMRTDLAAYDLVRKGLAPWPSYDELETEGRALRTSLFIDLDPGHHLERLLIGKPMHRRDITTLGEARIEQPRWLERSFAEEWPLTYSEYAELPLDTREAYYANRCQVCDEEEKFTMVLNYRRALGDVVEHQHPLEFRHIEDSYTYTPKESPVLQDLLNWDDPLDAPWRVRVEECIRDCIAYGWPPEPVRFHSCFEVYDVTWLPGVIKVVIEQTRDEGGHIKPDELKLLLLKLERRLKELDDEEHTRSISTHTLLLMVRDPAPKAIKELLCRRDWNCNIGKKVSITFTDETSPKLRGIMKGSHSSLGLSVEVKGKQQTLPLNFIQKVELI